MFYLHCWLVIYSFYMALKMEEEKEEKKLEDPE